MLLFQWNALRAGDRVMVHDDHDPELELHEGAVRLVQTRQPGANEIGIRLDDPASEMLRPRRHAVHLLPIDPGFPCWRCDAIAASPTDADRVVAA
jgi:hypothetical protein